MFEFEFCVFNSVAQIFALACMETICGGYGGRSLDQVGNEQTGAAQVLQV